MAERHYEQPEDQAPNEAFAESGEEQTASGTAFDEINAKLDTIIAALAAGQEGRR